MDAQQGIVRGPRRSRGWVAWVVLAVLFGFAAACASDDDGGTGAGGPTTTEPSDPERGGILVYAFDGEVDGWHPGANAWTPGAHSVARAIYDPLTVIDVDGGWHPYLAESFESNEDFTEWTITVRPNVRFHNDEVLDADALAMHLEMVSSSPVSAQAFASVESVQPVDDRSVRVTFEEPWAQFPTLMADQPGFVMAPEMIEEGNTREPIGTGPFKFEEWVPDSHLRAEANSTYWQDGLPYVDVIEFRPLPDPTSQLSALRAGDIDALVTNSALIVQQVDDLEGSGDLKVIRDDGPEAEAILVMNLDESPGSNDLFRRAMAHAVDPQAIVDTLYGGQFELADQPYAPGSPWHTEVDYPEHDLEEARALVDEYEETVGPAEVTISVNAHGEAMPVVQLIQQQLSEAGIDANIEAKEFVAFTQGFITGDFEVAYVGGFFYRPDPDNDYHFMHSKHADPDLGIMLNFPKHRSDVVDEALDSSRATDDLELRQEQYAKIWETWAEDLPYLWLYHQQSLVVSRPQVWGLGPWEWEGAEMPAIFGGAQFTTRAWLGG